MDEMMEIIICKYCKRPEYYGQTRWGSGKQMCRCCYREDYENKTGRPYQWDDLDGPVPTMADYHNQ